MNVDHLVDVLRKTPGLPESEYRAAQVSARPPKGVVQYDIEQVEKTSTSARTVTGPDGTISASNQQKVRSRDARMRRYSISNLETSLPT